MASGLDNLFTTYGNDYGALGAYQAGQRRGLADQATRIANDQKSAELARYTDQTPDSNRVLAAQANKGELDNLQGQADQAAGVPAAKAQANLGDAKVTALKAQQALQLMPVEQKAKMFDAMKKGHTQLMDLVASTLSSTSDVPTTIAQIEKQYPGVEKDPSWEQAKQQVSGMSAQQALNMVNSMRAHIASADAYGDSQFQGKMIMNDQDNTNKLEVAKIGAGATVQSAQLHGAAMQGRPSIAELYDKYLQQYNNSPKGSVEREQARQALNGLRGGMQSTQSTPLGDQTNTKEPFPADAPGAGGPAGGGLPTVSTQDDYNKLPSGSKYMDPNGQIRTKK